MFRSRIEENLKADEISPQQDEDLCYEIVKPEDEKLLTLEEARKLVEKNYVLNKEELEERFEGIFGSKSDSLLNQYVNQPIEAELDGGTPGRNYEEPSGFGLGPDESDSHSINDEAPKYIGRGCGMYEPGVDHDDVDEDVLLAENDLVSRTIHVPQRTLKDLSVPMTNYGKGPLPFWSNVFDDSTSEED